MVLNAQSIKLMNNTLNYMPKTFRKNFTENHVHALRAVELMVNATPQSIAFSYGSTGDYVADYWRRYLSDLANRKLVICQPIYISATNKSGGKSGQRLGSLFAVTAEGVKRLAEYLEKPLEAFYYPKGGITAVSPFSYPHRTALLEVLGLIIGLEKTLEDFEVLEIIPYFRHENTSTENKTGFAIGRVEVKQDSGTPYDSPVLIADAVVKIRIGDRVRLVVVELHRKTAPKEIIEALRKHAKAIEARIFNQKFEVPNLNFVISIHTDRNRRDNTLKQIKNGDFPNYERYMEGFNFATLDELIKGGINESLYQLDGKRGRIFEGFKINIESGI